MRFNLQYRVVLWFAANLDEELTSDDISVRFDIRRDRVPDVIAPLWKQEWISTEERQRGPLANTTWRPGPALLKLCRGQG